MLTEKKHLELLSYFQKKCNRPYNIMELIHFHKILLASEQSKKLS
jgi:hypothetical protein